MNQPATALKRVLVVDTDADSIERTALRLERLELEVLRAASAREALTLLENAEPHLVVMEWPLAGAEEGSLLHIKLKVGSVPVLYCRTEEAASAPALPKEGLLLSKQDRQELVNQVLHALFDPQSAAPSPEARAGKAPRQLLVIEDSPTLRGIVRRTLEKAFPNDVVREASDGRQALSEMTQKKVDLIITDLEMPGMDGFAFFGHLKRNPLLSKKPVIIFSGKISPELQREAAAMPNVRFLHKPAEPEKLVEAVTGLMEGAA